MPIWILQIILASIPLITKLVDKLVPSMVHPEREFKTKKWVRNRLDEFKGLTIEQIAKKGKK